MSPRPRPPRRKGRPTALGDVVDQVLGDLGLDSVAKAHRIGQIWPAAVGEQIAAHCRPVGIRGEVLELAVDSPVWSQQLQMRKPEITRPPRPHGRRPCRVARGSRPPEER